MYPLLLADFLFVLSLFLPIEVLTSTSIIAEFETGTQK